MRTFVYCRTSVRDRASGGPTLEEQRRQAGGYATMKGWEVAETFVEDGVGGSVPLARRPQGGRLLGAVRRGDAVIACRLDRMFRSASDALATLEVFREAGVALHLVEFGGDVCGAWLSKLVTTILSAVADTERERIRDRMREVRRHLASQGIYVGGKRPFGYDIVEGRLVPNALEQAALADMTARRRAGESYFSIGAAYGKPAMSIKRILDRVEGSSSSSPTV
jgi:DNA invertase Pin-like site-specific DNA recombinase